MQQPKSVIYQGELDYISRCVLDYPDIETGGDLFGFWTYSGFPVIQYVIGPGPRANHQYAFFNQDIEYLDSIGKSLRRKFGLQHIGEWHSHHKFGLAEPSGHDVSTVTKAISNYNLGKFFLVIANIRSNNATINGFMFNGADRHYNDSPWVVLEGESPMRRSFDLEFPNMVYIPKTEKAAIANLNITTLENVEYIKPVFTSDYWLSHRENHLELKTIVDLLTEKASEVNLFQRSDDKSIFIEFTYLSKAYSLSFDNDFPKTKPILRIMDEELTVLGDAIPWKLNDSISKSSIEFILSSLNAN